MSKISCEMIRDLFPSYIDGLTSEASNRAVEEHVANCEECRKLLSSMKSGEEAFAPEEPEKKEIDYLKKNRRRTVMIVLFSILGVLALGVLVVALRFFVIGDKMDFFPIVEVKGKTVNVKYGVAMDSATAIGGFYFTEKDGIVTVTARRVLVSPLHPVGELEATYTASQLVREVRAGDRVVWYDQTKLSIMASNLWACRHDFIGDMPANNKAAREMYLWDVLGTYTSELETREEPYGWKIILEYDLSIEPELRSEETLRGAAFLLISIIRNLDHVTFSYTKDNVAGEITFTRADADAFFEQPVSTCMENPKILEHLVQKTGWQDTFLHLWLRNSYLPPWYMEETTVTP